MIDQATQLPVEVSDWLRDFARCVRERMYERARPLFHADVFSFGTVVFTARGLEELMDQQWREVWDFTQGFEFDYRHAHRWGEGELICVAVPWTSQGFQVDGRPFTRRGRSTLLLKRVPEGWKAVHSHFSLDPGSNISR